MKNQSNLSNSGVWLILRKVTSLQVSIKKIEPTENLNKGKQQPILGNASSTTMLKKYPHSQFLSNCLLLRPFTTKPQLLPQ